MFTGWTRKHLAYSAQGLGKCTLLTVSELPHSVILTTSKVVWGILLICQHIMQKITSHSSLMPILKELEKIWQVIYDVSFQIEWLLIISQMYCFTLFSYEVMFHVNFSNLQHLQGEINIRLLFSCQLPNCFIWNIFPCDIIFTWVIYEINYHMKCFLIFPKALIIWFHIGNKFLCATINGLPVEWNWTHVMTAQTFNLKT